MYFDWLNINKLPLFVGGFWYHWRSSNINRGRGHKGTVSLSLVLNPHPQAPDLEPSSPQLKDLRLQLEFISIQFYQLFWIFFLFYAWGICAFCQNQFLSRNFDCLRVVRHCVPTDIYKLIRTNCFDIRIPMTCSINKVMFFFFFPPFFLFSVDVYRWYNPHSFSSNMLFCRKSTTIT